METVILALLCAIQYAKHQLFEPQQDQERLIPQMSTMARTGMRLKSGVKNSHA